ncbi:MAG TPA: hypothetical protein VNY32_01295 [Candidatus Acidoferrales bacterium]|jgi:hypothetical protein|nr:hypothetical protein [Candidatus Acidoferrales bacterium]
MRFRLVYDGDLKAGGSRPRAREKWALREAFRPQLASLSATHPVMQGIGFTTELHEATYLGPSSRPVSPARVSIDITHRHHGIQETLLYPVQRGDYRFIPLVRKSLELVCQLDILFLRNDMPGSIVKSGGDLDNRIKTLFDGLRMPTEDEMAGASPTVDPFCCLLEDDSLISNFAVRTDRLLTDPNRSERRVLLVIEVKLTAIRLTAQNVGFLTD